MPYENVSVECDVIMCDNHDEDGYCNYDGVSSDLSPDEINCQEFHISHFNKTVASREQVEEFRDYLEDKNIPFVCINSESFHFQSIWVGLKNDFWGIVQGDQKDFQEFRFWKSVNGSIGCTHINQLELKFS